MPIYGRAAGDIVGSKERGMFFKVQLPPSNDFTGAVGWLRQKEGALYPDQTRRQIICDGKLWRRGERVIESYDLETGDIIDDRKAVTYMSVSYSGIVTDGKRYIYNVYLSTLYIFDTQTKQESWVEGMGANEYHSYPTVVFCPLGNCVYAFGGRHYSDKTSYKAYCYKYDIATAKITTITGLPIDITAGIGWEDSNGDVYLFGDSNLNGIGSIVKYIPSTNSYEIIRNNDISLMSEGFNTASLVIIPEHKVFYQKQTLDSRVIDIKTGEVFPSPVQTVQGSNISIQYVAADGDTLYSNLTTGQYKMMLQPAAPENSPIVCKIYEGQKFHTDQPFSISSPKLNITYDQQTAAQDIEIRQNMYSSNGTNSIFIET